MSRALLSVSDKRNLEPFAQALVTLGYELIATGGTYRAIEAAGIPVAKVAEVTNSPEILDGRVKTLHPHIHGAILAKRNEAHLAELQEHAIIPIDMVVGNLYPFREAVAKPDSSLADALENIDIGGPTMLRAAAKNFPAVTVVVDPDDYTMVIEKLETGGVDEAARASLALKAFAHTASYDAAISQYLEMKLELPQPLQKTLELNKIEELRYGENPHQSASLWRLGSQSGPVIDADILQGKAMSFNNYNDAEAAWATLSELRSDGHHICVAVKHTNPCGVAEADSLLEAYQKAHAADPVSIFGGIVAVSHEIDAELARLMSQTFLEIILAPSYSEEARSIFAKKKNLRLLQVSVDSDVTQQNIRSIAGGFLVQSPDIFALENADMHVVSERQPSAQELSDMRFAWKVCKHTKSNAIVLAQNNVTTGIGVGQVSRIWAAEQAIEHAGEQAAGSVLASDAFFPFDDVVRTAAAAGIKAVISPGGSRRDGEVIAACDELGMIMIFTGLRHFKH